MKIYLFRTHQRKCEKLHISFCGDLIIQLPHRATAQISRIFIFCIDIFDLFIDRLKIFIGNHCLSTQNQLTLVRNMQRHILKNLCIVRDDLSLDSISSCDRFDQFSALIRENNGQSVQFPGNHRFLRAKKFFQPLYFLCLIQ